MGKPVTSVRTVSAPPQAVFDIISDPRRYAEIQPDIVGIDVLQEDAEGRVERFRETRRMKGREAAVELRITERTPAKRIRFVSDAGGTTWDTVYSLRSEGEGTALHLEMQVRPYKFFARILTPLILPMVRRGIESDMDRVADHFSGR
ncbi:MAG: SRPBCC family protein [Planctomycetes bacterium]|nr:SRPBCC family protein [Planctomycetota bacterium]MCB9891678.1 SRPBCC family protein [Planctomycetota bacterium]MCB9920386.1 SRPBCC family protein [Planctomycetota bacterium]